MWLANKCVLGQSTSFVSFHIQTASCNATDSSRPLCLQEIQRLEKRKLFHSTNSTQFSPVYPDFSNRSRWVHIIVGGLSISGPPAFDVSSFSQKWPMWIRVKTVRSKIFLFSLIHSLKLAKARCVSLPWFKSDLPCLRYESTIWSSHVVTILSPSRNPVPLIFVPVFQCEGSTESPVFLDIKHDPLFGEFFVGRAKACKKNTLWSWHAWPRRYTDAWLQRPCRILDLIRTAYLKLVYCISLYGNIKRVYSAAGRYIHTKYGVDTWRPDTECAKSDSLNIRMC